MSLFKAREWWAAKTGSEEEFAPTAFCVADVDNQGGPQSAKVVTGSLSGLLRVYHPRQRDYRAEDLLLEQHLDAPILQISAGRFVAAHERTALAILHPRKLSIYEVSAGGTQGAFHALSKVSEHALDRNSFNMAHGRFGSVPQSGGRGHDAVAVQSIDGTVTIFDGDTLAFARPLAGFLVPGPWVYTSRSDSFYTFSSSLEVQCFKHATLTLAQAEAGPAGGPAGAGAANGAGAADVAAGAGVAATQAQRKVSPDWSVVVGEHVVDLAVARFTQNLATNQFDVVVLGVQTLFALKESGGIRYQRRLDMQPSALHVYSAGDAADPATGGADNVIVCNATGAMLVFRESALIWAARAERPPVALAVASFGTVPGEDRGQLLLRDGIVRPSPPAAASGLICTMTADGSVSVLYLGTDPPTNKVGGAHERDLDYDRMDEEHRGLLQKIREATTGGSREPAEFLTLKAQVPDMCDATQERGLGDDGSSGGPTATVRISVSYNGTAPLESVALSVACSPPFASSQQFIQLPAVAGGSRTPLVVPVVFRADRDRLPYTLKATVIANYSTAEDEPRCARCDFQLPLSLVCQVIAPVKNADFKVTLDTNKPPVALPSLFEDVLRTPFGRADSANAAANVVSFQYRSGQDVTILLSKNAGRYRLQSGSFEALWLLAQELRRRLQRTAADCEVTFNEPLPLQEYFDLIDAHFDQRRRIAELTQRLEERAQQFRVVQKRLLVRFKDRNPAPLANLDLLLSGTHEQLMALSHELEAAQEARARAVANLSCGTQLINLLIAMRFDLDEENSRMLHLYLSPSVDCNSEQGWEERTDAALSHLLRHTLGKNQRDGNVATVATTQIVMPQDVTKLKKHITVMCDRLSRGGRFRQQAEPPPGTQAQPGLQGQ